MTLSTPRRAVAPRLEGWLEHSALQAAPRCADAALAAPHPAPDTDEEIIPWSQYQGLFVGSNSVENATIALKRGADILLRDEEGNSLAIKAARNNHLEMVQLLVGHGDELVEATVPVGGLPLLHETCQKGRLRMAEVLLFGGMDVDAEDEMHATPLFAALNHGHDDIVDLLLSSGANPRHMADGGMTPLLLAVATEQYDVAWRLVLAGAGISVVDASVLPAIISASDAVLASAAVPYSSAGPVGAVDLHSDLQEALPVAGVEAASSCRPRRRCRRNQRQRAAARSRQLAGGAGGAVAAPAAAVLTFDAVEEEEDGDDDGEASRAAGSINNDDAPLEVATDNEYAAIGAGSALEDQHSRDEDDAPDDGDSYFDAVAAESLFEDEHGGDDDMSVNGSDDDDVGDEDDEGRHGDDDASVDECDDNNDDAAGDEDVAFDNEHGDDDASVARNNDDDAVADDEDDGDRHDDNDDASVAGTDDGAGDEDDEDEHGDDDDVSLPWGNDNDGVGDEDGGDEHGDNDDASLHGRDDDGAAVIDGDDGDADGNASSSIGEDDASVDEGVGHMGEDGGGGSTSGIVDAQLEPVGHGGTGSSYAGNSGSLVAATNAWLASFGAPCSPSSPEEPPPDLCCPITVCLLDDPVAASDGHVYSRAAIEEWLRHSRTSPMTGARLASRKLFPSLLARSLVANWREQHGAAPA